WKLTLSETAEAAITLGALPVAPAGATELSTTDVDGTWFQQNSGESALPSRPLSASQLALYVSIPAGQTSIEVSVPTVTDAEAEGEELVRLQFERLSPTGTGFEVTGRVAQG
ncbi:MAG TPA: hypothetical protein VF330_06145, partial [Lentzea sp.]